MNVRKENERNGMGMKEREGKGNELKRRRSRKGAMNKKDGRMNERRANGCANNEYGNGRKLRKMKVGKNTSANCIHRKKKSHVQGGGIGGVGGGANLVNGIRMKK